MSTKKETAKEDTTKPNSPETPVTKATKKPKKQTNPDADTPDAEQFQTDAAAGVTSHEKTSPATVDKDEMKDEHPRVRAGKAGGDLSSEAQRVKIAEIATQLVAAQIAAHASYQAAVDVATEQRELLAESLETLARMLKPAPALEPEPATDQEQESINDQDREPAFDQTAFQIIPDRLKYAGVRIRKPRVLSPLSGSDLDQLFTSAMHRAQKMLRAQEQEYRTVWAEQIFEDGESLSENQIFERFNRYEWPDLSARPSVIALMSDVDRWFSEHYHKLNGKVGDEDQGSEPEPALNEAAIFVRAMDLCDERVSDGSNRYQRDYKAVGDAIKCFLRSRDSRVLGTLAGAYWNNRARNLIFMLYNKSAPAPRDSDPGDDRATTRPKAPTRVYRPWGIFRYLRLYAGKSGDDNGALINSRIRTQALKLNPDLLVNVLPVAPPEFEFGPIRAEMDDLVDSQEHEDAEPPDSVYSAGGATDNDTDEDLPI